MKNFGTLYKYELKKLLKRKLSWAAVLALAVFCVFSIVRRGNAGAGFTIPVMDENGNETGKLRDISGEEIRDTYLKTAGALDGRVMDDAFFQEMLENLPNLKTLDREDLDLVVYFWTENATWHHVYSMVVGLCEDPGSLTAEKFYAHQREQTRLRCEQYGRDGLSQGEMDYWAQQAEKIQKPFVYQDYWRGTTYLTDFFYILLGLLPVAAAVCVCTVFSEDRRNRVDALVFTTRKCRVPLYLAKILAGATTAVLAGVFIVGAVVTAYLAVWGVKGLDTPFQMYDIANPRPVTIWQMFLPMLVLLVLYTLLYGGVAMLAAAVTRSSIVSLAVPVLLVQVLDRWYQLPYGWAGYLPDNLMGWSGPNNVELVKVFGVYLNNFQFGPLLYTGLAALLLVLCWPCWRWNAEGRV